MRKMMTWCLGFVLAHAAMAQAQSEPSGNAAPKALDSDGQNLNLIVGSLADQSVYEKPFQRLDPQQDLSFFVYQNTQDEGSGLTLAPVDEALKTHLKLPNGQGLIATSVLPQGPAARAGICQNDILLTLDGVGLPKPEYLEELLKTAGNKTLGLVLLHQGQKKTVKVQPKIKVTFEPVQPGPPEFWIGVSVTPLEPALRAQLQIPADRGLITTSVMNDGPAVRAGFKVNDILLTINDRQLGTQAELAKLVQQNGEKPLAVEIVREGSRRKIELTPERRKGPQLLTSKVQHNVQWDYVRPGAVLQDIQGGGVRTPDLRWNTAALTLDTLEMQDDRASKVDSQPHAVPLAKRLDTMASEIKELRKAVEELSKVLKDRK